MTTTTEERGKLNLFAKEPRMYTSQEDLDSYTIENHNEFAEKLNGRAAMLGLLTGFISYAITGNFFFGLV